MNVLSVTLNENIVLFGNGTNSDYTSALIIILQVFLYIFLTTALSFWGFFRGKFGLISPGESRLRQNRATQPTVHAGCFSISIIHRTRTWTQFSLVQFNPWAEWVVGEHEERFSRDPLPVFPAGGSCEQFWNG